jgi:hypothetical protein
VAERYRCGTCGSAGLRIRGEEAVGRWSIACLRGHELLPQHGDEYVIPEERPYIPFSDREMHLLLVDPARDEASMPLVYRIDEHPLMGPLTMRRRFRAYALALLDDAREVLEAAVVAPEERHG